MRLWPWMLGSMVVAAWAIGSPPTPAADSPVYAFTFSTAPHGGKYTPRHVLAVWVADARGRFVKSLLVRAGKRAGDLKGWRSASEGNRTDAVTGATLPRHDRHRAVWNGTDARGNPVPDGDYELRIELCEGAPSVLTPKGHLPFVKGSATAARTFPDLPSFKDLSLKREDAGHPAGD